MEQSHSFIARVVDRQRCRFTQLSFYSESELNQIRNPGIRRELHDAAWSGLRLLCVRPGVRISRICDDILKQLPAVVSEDVENWARAAAVVKEARASSNHCFRMMSRPIRKRDSR